MEYTSISSQEFGNYQSDFNSVTSFQKWCERVKPRWAKLFLVRNGELQATYYVDSEAKS